MLVKSKQVNFTWQPYPQNSIVQNRKNTFKNLVAPACAKF